MEEAKDSETTLNNAYLKKLISISFVKTNQMQFTIMCIASSLFALQSFIMLICGHVHDRKNILEQNIFIVDDETSFTLLFVSFTSLTCSTLLSVCTIVLSTALYEMIGKYNALPRHYNSMGQLAYVLFFIGMLSIAILLIDICLSVLIKSSLYLFISIIMILLTGFVFSYVFIKSLTFMNDEQRHERHYYTNY